MLRTKNNVMEMSHPSRCIQEKEGKGRKKGKFFCPTTQ